MLILLPSMSILRPLKRLDFLKSLFRTPSSTNSFQVARSCSSVKGVFPIFAAPVLLVPPWASSLGLSQSLRLIVFRTFFCACCGGEGLLFLGAATIFWLGTFAGLAGLVGASFSEVSGEGATLLFFLPRLHFEQG